MISPYSLKEVKLIMFSCVLGFFYFFFEREFQPMASAPDDSSLSSCILG